jgi:hypothetical protein
MLIYVFGILLPAALVIYTMDWAFMTWMRAEFRSRLVTSLDRLSAEGGAATTPDNPAGFDLADFGLIVIGSGPGGYVAAITPASWARRSSCVEREGLGGICTDGLYPHERAPAQVSEAEPVAPEELRPVGIGRDLRLRRIIQRSLRRRRR